MNIKATIDELAELKQQGKLIKDKIDLKTKELQEQCIAVFEDKNIKTTEVYGTENNSAIATYYQKLEILNYQALESIIDKNLLNEKIERRQEVKYDIDEKFKEAIIIFYTNDYMKDLTIEELVKIEFSELDNKVQNLLIKKLKGNYKADKKLLRKYIPDKDLDVELFTINKIKNYDKVKAFFNVDDIQLKENLKRYISLDETVKITIKYEN
ncbi:hypothetical protein [[Clostridium] colinum]|uniref:hypothetical protein n=1 Tax=[Clostridium] colinum TaxID=36835 RepID=UPI002025AA05|nr:hypothetical protein [[Clostridium] colinum]